MLERGFIVLNEYLGTVDEMDKLITKDYPDKYKTRYEFRAMKEICVPYGEIVKVSTGVTAYMQDTDLLVFETPDYLLERGIQVVYKSVTNEQYEEEIEIWLHSTTRDFYVIDKFDLIALGTFIKLV